MNESEADGSRVGSNRAGSERGKDGAEAEPDANREASEPNRSGARRHRYGIAPKPKRTDTDAARTGPRPSMAEAAPNLTASESRRNETKTKVE